MQSVQQSMTRTDIDVSYITSRLLVMPSPSEGLESTYKSNNIDDVRHYVETHFAPHKVSVYNFGMKNGPRLPPPIRTVDVGSVWTVAQGHAPLLHVSLKREREAQNREKQRSKWISFCFSSRIYIVWLKICMDF